VTDPPLQRVLEKAAQLQAVVPGAVLVGGSAAALHGYHRESLDNDHVLADLDQRFEVILENLEALADWSLAKAQPGKIILGELGGIETGVRQLLRGRPLETTEVKVEGKRLVVPTAAEILRIKAWLCGIDDYYADVNRRPEAVSSQVARQLADPRPRDAQVTRQLASYKSLEPRWHDWATVTAVLADLAERMTR
jgi:hypothetical protein